MSSFNPTITRLIGAQHRCICINITEFTAMLKDGALFNWSPITSRQVLMTGLYADLDGMKCFVSKRIAPGCFRTSDIDNPNVNSEADWSEEQSFEAFEKENQHLIILA